MRIRFRRVLIFALLPLTALLVIAAIDRSIHRPPAVNRALLLGGTGGGVLDAQFFASGSRVGRIVAVPAIETHDLLGRQGKRYVLWPGVDQHIHQDRLTAARISPDGTRVVTGSLDGTARIWRIETGELLSEFNANALEDSPQTVVSLAFGPGGETVLTGLGNGAAWLWQADTGQTIRAFRGHRGPITSMAFSPDGTRILTGSADGTAIVWNAARATPRARLDVDGRDDPAGRPGRSIGAVAFSADGQRILTGSDDGVARLWRVDSGALIAEKTIASGTRLASVAFSPDGSIGFAGSARGDTQIWRLQTGQILTDLGTIEDHIGAGRFLIDRSNMFLATDSSRVLLMGAAEQGPIEVLTQTSGAILDARLIGDGVDPAWVSTVLAVEYVDVHTGAREHHVMWKHWQEEPYLLDAGPVRFNDDGDEVVAFTATGRPWMWDVEAETGGPGRDGNGSALVSLDFAENREFGGSVFAAGFQDGTVYIMAPGWKIDLPAHPASVNSVAFSPDGKLLATATEDMTIRLWSLRARVGPASTRRFVATLTPEDATGPGRVKSVRFSPDGDTIAAIFGDGTVRIWQTESYELLATLEADESLGSSHFMGAEGRHVYVPQSDRTARVWDLNRCSARRCRFVAAARLTDDGRPLHLAISSDNRLLLTGRGRGVEGLWSIREAGLVGDLADQRGDVHSMLFDENGNHALVVANDGTVGVWDIQATTEEN